MSNAKEMVVNAEYDIVGKNKRRCMKIDRSTSVWEIVKFVGDHELPSSNLSFMILSLFHGVHEHLWVIVDPTLEEAYIYKFEDIAFDVIIGERREEKSGIESTVRF